VSEPPFKTNFRAILKPPSWAHWFGTDELGRDILSRVVHGARISLELVLSAVLGALLVGGGLGIWAGFRGGYAEMMTMRAIDLLLALPGFLIALVTITIRGVGTVNLIIAVGIYSIPAFARIGHVRILVRHVLPNVLSPLVVQASLRMATALLLASSLSFLGLGVQPPMPEWGAMLANGRSYLSTSPHVVLFPGLAIMAVTLGFNLLGDGLRDVFDPRLPP